MTTGAVAVENHVLGKLRVAFGGLLLVGCILVCHYMQGGHVSSVAQVTAAIIIGAGVVAGGLMGFRWQGGGTNSFAVFFMRGLSRTDAGFDHRQAALRLEAMGKSAIFVGVLGNIIGLIYVMENLDKPAMIGPGIAAAYVASFYSNLCWAWCKSLQANHVAKMIDSGHMPSDGPDRVDLGPLLIASNMILLFTVFVVLYAIQVPS